MSNFTVKVQSEFPTSYSEDGVIGETLRTSRSQLFLADKVDIQRLKKETVVSLDENDIIFSVPHHIDVDEWRDGVTTAIYIENANGKTTEVIRAFKLEDGEC
jgi:hypothetical protein